MTEKVDLVVVGAGPAGLSAAVLASYYELSTIVIDSYPEPGGQYLKQSASEFTMMVDEDDKGRDLLEDLAKSSARLISGAIVWGIFPEGDDYLLCLYGPDGTPRRLQARKVILAPGAYDRPVPFPGWTLPGVITAGAALTMVKNQHLLPGRRVLLSGSGPLQWVLASQLISGGAEVVGILDANPFPLKGWKYLDVFLGQMGRMLEGWNARQVMRKAGVSVRWKHTVRRVEGDGRVERAVFGPLDGGDDETAAVDTVCLGYGFLPSIQLSRQVGCEHYYDVQLGVYLPVRDEWLQTSLPGIFVAGDGAGIGGKDVAQAEGRLCAMGAATQLDVKIPKTHLQAVRLEWMKQKRFASVLDDLFPFPPEMWELLAGDTLICRCEEVTVNEVRQAVVDGATTVNAIKNLTRTGMGRCQARMCGNLVMHVAARELGKREDEVGFFYPHPPVLPVPLDGVLDEEQLASLDLKSA